MFDRLCAACSSLSKSTAWSPSVHYRYGIHITYPGRVTCAAGWGATVFGPNRSEILREVEMPVVSTQTCSDGNSWFQPVDDTSMVCAGFGGDSKVRTDLVGDFGDPSPILDYSGDFGESSGDRRSSLITP